MSVNPLKAPVSVLVLTCNEEANIEACLASTGWASEVFVVDSLSSDRTVEIAENSGAKVFSHPFEGYARQRNWALDNLPFFHEWVLMLDADERVPTALAGEIEEAIRNEGNENAGFYLKFRHIFLGRWLKHGGLYPTWILRLFKRESVRFEERPVNERAILEGSAGYLDQPFEHCDRKPLSDWIIKHNRYADLEAEEFLQETLAGGYDSSIKVRFWERQVERKRWIKLKIWNRLPLFLRPFLFFFRNYFLKLGFLDGIRGLIYHVLWSFWARFLIDVKIFERQARQRTLGARQACENRKSQHPPAAICGIDEEGIRGHAGSQ